jgi:hypothetical protein
MPPANSGVEIGTRLQVLQRKKQASASALACSKQRIDLVISMTVAPVPVFLLLFRRQSAKVSMFVAVVFAGPALVEDDLVVIPNVVVAVVGVVDAVIVMCASRARYGRRQGGGEKK